MSNLHYRRAKISLIGSGNIGTTLSTLSSFKELGDIVMLDLNEEQTQGKALDISQSCSINGSDVKIIGTNNYEMIANSDVIITTAGIPRKPGMSRDDLFETNSNVIKSIAGNIKKYAPNAFVIVVTNPLDAMVYLMQKESGLPTNKVVGMAGVLDSSRFNFFLAEALNISLKDIKSFVLGGHGDTMVPMIRYTTIAGIPLPTIIEMGWITTQQVDDICERTKNGGAEIVKLLGNGSAFVAPAFSAIQMAETYLHDQKKILPCAVYLSGEYNQNGIYFGSPAIIGKNGVEKVVEVPLNSDEQKLFDTSADSVKALIKKLK